MIVNLKNISKVYKVYDKPIYRLKELVLLNQVKCHKDFVALNDISFSLKKGDRLGIVGENGSGKSTLLKIISNVLTPTSGEFSVNGKVTSLLELGTGFNQELSGKENIFQNGILFGSTREEIADKYPQIVDFSEIRDFIDQPVKTYSSGMLLRLAFSCAAFVEPDILIIDEALSVGDAYFQNKCFYKIKQLLDKGVTFIYVSHNYDSVKSLCNLGLMLEKGVTAKFGNAQDVADFYLRKIFEKQNSSSWFRNIGNDSQDIVSDYQDSEDQNSSIKAGSTKSSSKVSTTDSDTSISGKVVQKLKYLESKDFENRVKEFRTGTGEVKIRNIQILSSDFTELNEVAYNQEIIVAVHLQFFQAVSNQTSLGIAICDDKGLQIIQFTSLLENIDLSLVEQGSETIITFQFTSLLCPGQFNIIAGLVELQPLAQSPNYFLTSKVIDSCINGLIFTVPYQNLPKALWGKVALPVVTEIHSFN